MRPFAPLFPRGAHRRAGVVLLDEMRPVLANARDRLQRRPVGGACQKDVAAFALVIGLGFGLEALVGSA